MVVMVVVEVWEAGRRRRGRRGRGLAAHGGGEKGRSADCQDGRRARARVGGGEQGVLR